MGQGSTTVSLIVSVLLHVVVGSLVIFGLPNWQPKRPTPPAPIAVEFINIAEKTQVKAPEPEAKREDEVQAKTQPVVARAETVVEDVGEAVPLPTPIKKAAPTPKPKPKLSDAERRKRRITARARPRPKPKAPSRFKSSIISSVIDKSIKEEETQRRARTEEASAKKPEVKADPLAGIRGRFATASLVDALSQKLRGCWIFPKGAKDIEKMQVTVRIHLRPDGELSREPQYTQHGDLSDGFYQVFAESALRAVRRCAPFKEADLLYKNGQQSIDFTFYGSEFSGG